MMGRVDTDQDQVRVFLHSLLPKHSMGQSGHSHGVVTSSFQISGEQLSGIGVVVDDQDVGHAASLACISRKTLVPPRRTFS